MLTARTKWVTYSILLGAALLCGDKNLAAAAAAESDSDFFFTGVASAQANDNVFLSHTNAKSDTIFDLTPGLEFDFGKNSLTKGMFSINEDFQIYGSESSLNTGLTNAAFTSAYDDNKTKLNLNASYHIADQATRDVHLVGVLVKRDLYHAEALGEDAVTEKTSVGAGVVYDDTQYKHTGYTNWEWIKVPLKYYYEVEPKLDLSAGFTYKDNQLGTGGVNSNEYFYNVGARGEFTPKLTGELSVGYEQIQFAKGVKSKNGVGVDSNFTYAYTPKTTVTFGVSNDFGYSASGGSSYRIFGLNGGVSTAINDQWKANAQLSYNHYDYISTTEKDDFYNGQLGATYIINVYLSVTGAYTYTEDSSNITADSFTNNIFSISASLRF